MGVRGDGDRTRRRVRGARRGAGRYDIGVEGFEGGWYSVTDRRVLVPRGEERTVYFYFSPEESGRFNPVLKAETGDREFEEAVSITSG